MKYRFWALVESTLNETLEQPGGIFRVAEDGSTIELLVAAGQWEDRPELIGYVMRGDSGALPIDSASAGKLIAEFPWPGARPQEALTASAAPATDDRPTWTLDIDSEPGWALVRCGDVIDSRWRTMSDAETRRGQLRDQRAAQLAVQEPDGEQGPLFYAVLAVDEWETNDNRYFERFEWDTLPLPFMGLTENQGGGHWGAELGGKLETIERMSDGRRIFATGHLDVTDKGDELAQQIGSQSLRFVSVDPADVEVEEEITKIGTDGWPLDGRLRFTRYVIGGATACPFPGIRLAVVWLDGMDAPAELTMLLPAPVPRVQIPEIVDVDDDDIIVIMASAAAVDADAEPTEHAAILADTREQRALLASAAASCVLTRDCGGPALPPEAMFAPPQLSGPTPLSVELDGHIFGHFALWNVPHRGFLHYQWSDKIYAPRSHQSYAQFMTKSTQVACCADPDCGHDRKTIKTGTLVLGTNHAAGRLTPAMAAAYYENTGLAVADVVVGEDAHGPWLSGALRPGVDDKRVRELLGAAPSGDWRWFGGDLELMAILMVNSEGIPVRASAYVEEGEVRALFGGFGAPMSDRMEDTETDALVASVGASLAKRRPASNRAQATRVPPGLVMVEKAKLDQMERDLELLRPLIADRIEDDLAPLLNE